MSRHKVLAAQWGVAARCAILALVGTTVAIDCGALPKFEKGIFYSLYLLMVLAVVGVCLVAFVKAADHGSRYCAKCGKTIRAREMAGGIPDKQWWVAAICERCMQREHLLSSLPNREYTYANEAHATRWHRWIVFLIITGTWAVTMCFVLDFGIAHGIATLVAWGALSAFLALMRRTVFYGMSFCTRCKRDFNRYEPRFRSSQKPNSYICERCSEGGWEDDAADNDDEESDDKDDENGEEVEV